MLVRSRVLVPLVLLGAVALVWGQEAPKSGGKPGEEGLQPGASSRPADGAKDGGSAKGSGKDGETKAAIGKPAPDFELKGTDGKTYKLSALKDKIVVLEWYSKDCPTCKQLLPKIKETSEKYQKKGVVWLAIDSTHSHKLEDNIKAAKDEKLPHPILADFDGKTGRAFGALRTPHVFIINKGELVYVGALTKRGEDRNYAAEALDALLDHKPVPLAETYAFG